jgi:hypothetical protein
VQAGAVVVLAMGMAVILGGGDLGVKESAISALIIMITFRSSQAGFPIERFLEAWPLRAHLQGRGLPSSGP